MKLVKPRFWDKKNHVISLLLLPISLIFQFIIRLRNYFITEKNFQIPIICVGNIYLGGTGKTPLTIMIANHLLKIGKKPAIIKKFYANQIDEHKLIKNYFDFLFLDKKRSKAIISAKEQNINVCVLDDGFQDLSIKKDLNIICFNSKQLIGNGLTIPSGPLREKISSLKNAQVIVINGNKDQIFEKNILNISKNLKIFYSKYIPTNLSDFHDQRLFAFAGIGNPNNFFSLLESHNLKIEKKVSFPDHYSFTEQQIKNMIKLASEKKLKMVTTEKDFNRIKHMGFKEINFLKVKLEITKKDELINLILNCKK